MAIPSGSSTLKLPMPPTGQGRPSMFSLPSFRSGKGPSPSGTSTPLPDDVSEAARLLSRSGTIDDQGGTYGAVEDSESQKAPSTPRLPSKRVPLKAKARYYIPSLEWIPNYSLSYLGGDILAGVTVAAMLIPQSVSYATSLARLSPTTGLFAASIPPLVYALLGSSRQLNVAPEAALSLIVGQTIQSILHNDPHTHPVDPATLSLVIASVIVAQVGLISFVLGFFRLGFIDVVLSRALLRGFITAIAIVIALEQLIPMLGLVALEHKFNPETTLQKFLFLLENMTHAHRPTVTLSFSSFALLVSIRNLKRFVSHIPLLYRMPEVLLVVLGSTFLCYKFNWDDMGIDILGDVKLSGGAGYVHFPLKHTALKYIHETTSAAVLISIIGFLDSIVAAKQNAARFGYTISPNRELVALGAANLVASFVPGTLPAWGSITRSKINADVGGRTQMASIVCAVLVLLATFFLLPFLYYLPKCVLAAIICMVVLSLLGETPEDIHYYYTMRSWVDLGLMTLTFVLTMIWNVQVGVVVSMVVSLLLVVRRSSRTRMTILGHIPGTDTWKPLSEHPAATEDLPGVLIVRLRESLDFANTAQLKERLRRLELYGTDPSHPSEAPRRQQARVLVFHMADVESADASAVMILKELFKEYKARGVDVHITHLRHGTYQSFERAGVVRMLGEEAFHEDVATAAGNISRVASEGNIAGR